MLISLNILLISQPNSTETCSASTRSGGNYEIGIAEWSAELSEVTAVFDSMGIEGYTFNDTLTLTILCSTVSAVNAKGTRAQLCAARATDELKFEISSW